MFNVVRHHPQIGCEFDGGGGPLRRLVWHPGFERMLPEDHLAFKSIPSQETPLPNPLLVCHDAIPGFKEAWDKFPNLDQNARLVRTLQELSKPKEAPKYYYIEKLERGESHFRTKDGDYVTFHPGGAKLQIRDNGVEYRYEIPGYTITCNSWQGDLLIKHILHSHGGAAHQMYIPEGSELLKYLKVKKAVETGLSPTHKPTIVNP